MSNTGKIYLVGGAVRDMFLETPTKDLDYLVDVQNWDQFKQIIIDLGAKIVQERPKYKVIRAVHPTKGGLDFTMPRIDVNCNGRQAETKMANSVIEDLARRDFTMNAIAIEVNEDLTPTNNIIDPFGGMRDIGDKILKFVGNPRERIKEDELRVLRGVRFALTKSLVPERNTLEAIRDTLVSSKVSNERIMEELQKMFNYGNNVGAINKLSYFLQDHLLNRVKIKITT